MEKHILPGIRLLDIGTGTGVLVIAGIKLGADSGIGVDVDEWSYDNARENLKLNAVENQARIFRGDISSITSELFGMIVANIQLNVIKHLLIEMRNRLIPTGILIVSGLLFQDRDEMLVDLEAGGYRVIDELRENEWIAFACLK